VRAAPGPPLRRPATPPGPPVGLLVSGGEHRAGHACDQRPRGTLSSAHSPRPVPPERLLAGVSEQLRQGPAARRRRTIETRSTAPARHHSRPYRRATITAPGSLRSTPSPARHRTVEESSHRRHAALHTTVHTSRPPVASSTAAQSSFVTIGAHARLSTSIVARGGPLSGPASPPEVSRPGTRRSRTPPQPSDAPGHHAHVAYTGRPTRHSGTASGAGSGDARPTGLGPGERALLAHIARSPRAAAVATAGLARAPPDWGLPTSVTARPSG